MTGFKSEAGAAAHEQYMRTVYLDVLYRLDERDDPDHEFRGCYTGLFQPSSSVSKCLLILCLYWSATKKYGEKCDG
jgi:hypothetical protein